MKYLGLGVFIFIVGLVVSATLTPFFNGGNAETSFLTAIFISIIYCGSIISVLLMLILQKIKEKL